MSISTCLKFPPLTKQKPNGHKLGEMDVLFLKKAEELTLYIVDINKKLAAQSQIIAEQQKMLLELKAKQK